MSLFSAVFRELLDRGVGRQSGKQPWSVPKLTEHINRHKSIVTETTLYRWRSGSVHPHRGMLRDVIQAWDLGDSDKTVLWDAHRQVANDRTRDMALSNSRSKGGTASSGDRTEARFEIFSASQVPGTKDIFQLDEGTNGGVQISGWTKTLQDSSMKEEADTDRRNFLSTVTTSGLGLATDPLEAVRLHLASALSGGLATSSEPKIWDETVREYSYLCGRMELKALIADLAVDLTELQHHLRFESNSAKRMKLARSAAVLSSMMASSLTGIGHLSAARRWWRSSKMAADTSQDTSTQVWARGRLAVMLPYTYNLPSNAIKIADEAVSIKGEHFSFSAMAAKAQALAILRRDAEARDAMRSLESSFFSAPLRVLEDSNPVYGWPEYRLRHTESFVYSHIGDVPEAKRAQQRALVLYPAERVRDRTLMQLHGALCLVHEGHIDDAGHVASAAIQNLPRVERSTLILKIARTILSNIPGEHHQRSSIADLSHTIDISA